MNNIDYDALIKDIDAEQERLQKQKEAMLTAKRLSQQMEAKCKNCYYFVQHYGLSTVAPYTPKGFVCFHEIGLGHCVHGRIKNKERNNSCVYFEPKERSVLDGITRFYSKITP